MLRRLDVPLATIRQILCEGPQSALLDPHCARLERELALKRAALASVERLLAARDRTRPRRRVRVGARARSRDPFLSHIDPEWIESALTVAGAATSRRRRLPAEQPGVRIEGDDREGREQLLRYAARPAFSEVQLSLLEATR